MQNIRHPGPPLAQVIARQPVLPQRGGHAQGHFKVGGAAPGERGADIVIICIQALEGKFLFGPAQLWRNRFNQAQKIGGVLLAHHFQFIAGDQTFKGIFAHDFQHGKTRFAIQVFRLA